jgi:hypothetical protein
MAADILPTASVSGIKGYLFFALKVALSLAALSWVTSRFLGVSITTFLDNPVGVLKAALGLGNKSTG